MSIPENLDIEQPEMLVNYLRAEGHIGTAEEPTLVSLPGGVSNRTVLITRGNGEQWVIKQALEKLRVKADWFSSPERIHREAVGLKWMAMVAPDHAPAFVYEDTRHHILMMSAVPEPHTNWKSMLLQGQLDSTHIEQLDACWL